jgi:hypothetical protein
MQIGVYIPGTSRPALFGSGRGDQDTEALVQEAADEFPNILYFFVEDDCADYRLRRRSSTR